MYDVIVVGLGAVGSAALYHLARRGQRVLGVDRYAPPHFQGSTHGDSRIIRKAYFEGDQYLPILERAYVLWAELEEASGESLLELCGCLNVGHSGSHFIESARRSAEAIGLSHEILSARDVRRRFPAFHLQEDQVALFEPEAGIIRPERCVRTHLRLAQHHGAELAVSTEVLRWCDTGDGLRITTPDNTYHAARLILCNGAWIRDLFPQDGPPVQVERVVNAWFRPKAKADIFVPKRCPAFIWEELGVHFYGTPNLGQGVKAGLHHAGEIVAHPRMVARTLKPRDTEVIRTRLEEILPDACGEMAHASICMYTNTPDKHYLMDMLTENVVYASACSGHGFKASAATGEILADLVMGREPVVDIEAFRWRW